MNNKIDIQRLPNHVAIIMDGNGRWAEQQNLSRTQGHIAGVKRVEEIIDYASAGKKDAPSGTARELAYRLSQIQPPQITVPIDKTQGPIESRGVTLNGVQVHSVRLPGHIISAEVLFGDLDQRLSIRYDAGSSADVYVEGALLAIRKVGSFTGLKRGLDSVMEF